MKRGLIAALFLLIIVAAATGVVLSTTFPAATQPLAFNHVLHIEDVGAECTDCHLYALNGERATIPNLQTCADCHFEPIGESEDEARLVAYLEAEDPIPWQKVYWVPDHVYFSHRRHTSAAEIECASCHGAVGERTEPLTRPLVSMTMTKCMECHDRSGASNDCIVCHR